MLVHWLCKSLPLGIEIPLVLRPAIIPVIRLGLELVVRLGIGLGISIVIIIVVRLDSVLVSAACLQLIDLDYEEINEGSYTCEGPGVSQ